MGILDWWSKRGQQVAGDTQRGKHITGMVERVVQLTNPRLKFLPRYEKRLIPAVTAALNYAQNIVAGIPAPHEASAAGWASDPCMHSFFATTDEIKQAFSRSDELRTYFNQNPNSQQAYALLSMEIVERRIHGMALQGGIVRRDVAQTSMNFGDYRVRFCMSSEADLRHDLERRIVEHLALEGMARIVDDRSCREKLEEQRALLKVRLRLLERQDMGMRSAMGGDAGTDQSDITRLQAQIAENTEKLASQGAGAELLERELERIGEVLAAPAQNFHITNQRLCLDRMNILLDENNSQQGEIIEFTIGTTSGPTPQKRAFALVCFPRSDLLPDRIRFEAVAG